MEIKVDMKNKTELMNAIEGVLRMAGIQHMIAGIIDGKMFVAMTADGPEQLAGMIGHVIGVSVGGDEGGIAKLAAYSAMAAAKVDVTKGEEQPC